jgi:hypothetical protein
MGAETPTSESASAAPPAAPQPPGAAAEQPLQVPQEPQAVAKGPSPKPAAKKRKSSGKFGATEKRFDPNCPRGGSYTRRQVPGPLSSSLWRSLRRRSDLIA